MIAVGIVAAYFVLQSNVRKRDFSICVHSLFLWVLLGGFMGAKLLYLIVNAKTINYGSGLLSILTQGYVVYGGIIGGIIATLVYCKIKGIGILDCLDLLAPSVALAQGFGRIGCFLAGCCWGAETRTWFAVIFPEDSIAPDGVPLIPAQLVSAALCFLLFVILQRYSIRAFSKGELFGLYLLLYSIGRFCIEFFRGDVDRGNIGVLSTSQFIAIFVLIIGVIFFKSAFLRSRRLR
jgi:phosphatidylglycerol:prolipoprotein diacylglycerol transferase